MEMMFRQLLSLYSDSIPLLLKTFACFVFHLDSLREQMLRNSAHNFNKITILQTANKDLLACLKSLVTVNPIERVMIVWTGILPYVNQNCDIQELLGIVKVVKIIKRNRWKK